jgi:hypothetical protein
MVAVISTPYCMCVRPIAEYCEESCVLGRLVYLDQS